MKTSSFFKILTLGLVSSITLMASPDVGAQADCPSCRPVECRDQDGNTVAESFCNPATKPSTTGTVIAGSIAWCPAGPTYSRTGTWGTCQAILSCQTFIPSLTNEQTCSALTVATCASQPVCMAQSYGPGNQTRDNICVSNTGATVADSNCGAEPPTSQTCDGYARYASERSVCTNGTQTRTLTCKDSNGNIVADTNCPQPEPATTQACSIATYNREIGDWGTCNNGTQTRTLTCKDNNGNTVADTLCPQPGPATTQACTIVTEPLTLRYSLESMEASCYGGQQVEYFVVRTPDSFLPMHDRRHPYWNTHTVLPFGYDGVYPYDDRLEVSAIYMDQEGTILAPEGFYASSFSNSPEFSRVWSGRPNSGLQPIEGVSFFGGNYGIYPDDGVWKACVEL